MLSEESLTFTAMLNQLGIESPHLTYHLDSLGVLISKTESGKYRLSTFGRAAVATMGWVEEAPKPEPQPVPVTTKWKAVLVLLVIAIAVFAGVYYSQYQALSGLSKDYEELSEDFTQIKAEYAQIKAQYNETLLNYHEILADYNELLKHVQNSLPSDTPAYLCITRSFPGIDVTVSSNNLTEQDLFLFPELRETINKLEARIDRLETNDNTSEMFDNEISVTSFYSGDETEAYAHIAVAYLNNTQGRLIVGFLGAKIVDAYFLHWDDEGYWHYDFFSDIRCGERAYHVWIFFDKTGWPVKHTIFGFLRKSQTFSSAHGSS